MLLGDVSEMISGNLKSLHLLWVNLATSHRYSEFIGKKDIETFTSRLENEGLTFLTTALPSLGKALDKFHSTTEWTLPAGFVWRRTSPFLTER